MNKIKNVFKNELLKNETNITKEKLEQIEI